jgi:hypothetical protein
MEVYSVLGLFDNMVRLGKTVDDKRLALQQKYIYILYKKQDINVQEVRDKLYNQTLEYIQDNNYINIHQLFEEYIDYCENFQQNN